MKKKETGSYPSEWSFLQVTVLWKTRYPGLLLNFFLNYGGIWEIGLHTFLSAEKEHLLYFPLFILIQSDERTFAL